MIKKSFVKIPTEELGTLKIQLGLDGLDFIDGTTTLLVQWGNEEFEGKDVKP